MQTNCAIESAGGGVPGAQHTVAVASNCAIKYSVLSSVVQCAPVFTSLLLSVCRQTNCVSWAVGGVPPCRPHTHSGSTLSTANQPALSVKQTVFWPKIVKNWDNFGHNLVTVWQLSLSVKHSFVTKNQFCGENKIDIYFVAGEEWCERVRSALACQKLLRHRPMMWACQTYIDSCDKYVRGEKCDENVSSRMKSEKWESLLKSEKWECLLKIEKWECLLKSENWECQTYLVWSSLSWFSPWPPPPSTVQKIRWEIASSFATVTFTFTFTYMFTFTLHPVKKSSFDTFTFIRPIPGGDPQCRQLPLHIGGSAACLDGRVLCQLVGNPFGQNR